MTAPQRSPEWFQARKNRVTGSMVGAILGLSPHMTRDDAMRAMVRSALGAPTEFTGNPATEWGTANEANAILDYEMDTGNRVIAAPFVEWENWLGASVDGFVGEDGCIECKCPYSLRQSNYPAPFKTAAEQSNYMAQMQIEMYVTGTSWCDFIQWCPADMRVERVFVDLAWLNEMLPRLRQFHTEFLHERDHNAAAHLEPKRPEIDTPAALKALQEYDDLSEAIERATERRKEVLAGLVALSGERDALVCGRRLTRVEKAGAVSYAKAIKALMPNADLAPYTGAPSSFWKLS